MVQNFRKFTRVSVVLASFGVMAVLAASSSKNLQNIDHESSILRSGHQYNGKSDFGGIFPRDSDILERLAKRQQQSNSTTEGGSGSGSASGTPPPTNTATDSLDPTGSATDTNDSSSSDVNSTDSSTSEPSSLSLEPTASSTEPAPSSPSSSDEPISSPTETPTPEPTSSAPRETLTITGDEDDPGTTTKTLIVKPTGKESGSSTDNGDAAKISSANRSLQTNGCTNLKAGYGMGLAPVVAAAFAL